MQMENLERKDNRLLSSLVDLRLESVTTTNIQQQGKRKSRKINALKVSYDSEIYEHFSEIGHKKNLTDKNQILKSLKNHFTLSSLLQSKEIKELMIEKFKLCKVPEGSYLMRQNDMASSFFILYEGKLSVEINGLVKRYIQPGEGFGELALLYSAPRSASIKALKPSLLWYIDRETFKSAVSSLITKNYKENRKFVESNAFFKYLTACQRDKITSVAINQKFDKFSEICKEGELASSLFILKTGKLARFKGNSQVGVISKGESFEEYASLTKGCLRRETIKVIEEAEIIAIGIEDVENSLGKSLPIIILRNEAKAALKSSKIFERLNQEYIEKAIDCFKLRSVKQFENIVQKGDLCKNLIFFVPEGSYSVSESGQNEGIFGEKSLINEKEAFAFQVRMKQNGKIAWTSACQITKTFGCSLDEAVKNSASISKVFEQCKNKRTNVAEKSKNMKIETCQVLKKLGQGQFGNVFLITDAQKENVYALKCISKQETLKSKMEKHLINEKEALQTMNSPFIMEYIRSYKDDHYIYFLTQFINGMELFDTIRVIGLLNSSQSIFYGAQLLHIIETLHDTNYIYRDLKPENVMVCQNGYLKLIDLGTCKKLKNNEKTFTMIGTPNYMAPETLSGKGYSLSVDLWSLGIILYEFMAGFVPYGEDAEEPMEIYGQIINNPLKFPKNMKDSHFNSLITQLLSKNPLSRLGGSFASLKKHAAFSEVQWHEIISKNAKPHYEVPKDRLLNLAKLKEKSKLMKDSLKTPSKIVLNRRDPNWDQTF